MSSRIEAHGGEIMAPDDLKVNEKGSVSCSVVMGSHSNIRSIVKNKNKTRVFNYEVNASTV